MSNSDRQRSDGPLNDLDEWEDDLLRRYPEPADTKSAFTDSEKKHEEFRNYEAEARDTVKEFYRLNHRYQTLDFVKQKREDFLSLSRRFWSGFCWKH